MLRNEQTHLLGSVCLIDGTGWLWALTVEKVVYAVGMHNCNNRDSQNSCGWKMRNYTNR